MNDKLPIHQGLTELQEMKRSMLWTTIRVISFVFGLPLAFLLLVLLYSQVLSVGRSVLGTH